jgi:hemoglobin
MQIQEKPPYSTLFEWIGGEDKLKALIERFYDLMYLEPAYARLREVHGASLDQARQRTFWFLCGWMGGPQHYTERFGHPRLRARHLHVPIGVRERDQWLACMDQAMAEVGLDQALRSHLRESFFQTADWMRNVPEAA